MFISQSQFHEHDMSKLIKGAVVPRPIAWVSSVNDSGVRNLAPFSFFTVASMDPITLCFSIGSIKKDKDTLINIRETKQFAVNIVSEHLANQMYVSSKAYEPHEDEFTIADTLEEQCRLVNAPLVAEAPVTMECQLDKIIEIGSNNLVLGKVVGYHIKEEVYEEKDKVNPHKLAPVGRMAGDYSYIKEFYTLPNPDLPE
ncbi:flavin reductase family protein [Halobacillus salinarum]|uniref:Flavin reductase family protein n=1 Tax=Halobacillus salinarum TaxID=2932257 RepID=A0ABY4EKK3_9BACI|nr:flavin reductase family protein [Halobacillus salinarum]UOQ44510.1 flavin reductase family protein [Halobacillus salinarum]